MSTNSAKNSLLIIFILLVISGCIYFWLMMPDLDGVAEKLSFNAYDEQGNCIKRVLVPGAQDFIFSDDLPVYIVGAIIVAEDASFYDHHGVDWDEVKKSFQRNIKEHRYARGASTITQQLVKNAFLTQRKTLRRKLIEAVIAIRIEHILSKKEILDYYINHIELGPGIYGIREGSKCYFNTEPKNLTPYQAALIAFLIPNPTKYGVDYLTNPQDSYREKRIKKILKDMVCQKFITPEEFIIYFPSDDMNFDNCLQ